MILLVSMVAISYVFQLNNVWEVARSTIQLLWLIKMYICGFSSWITLCFVCRFLQKIIKYPHTCTLLADEKQLVWKLCFYLMSEKKALAKFVRSMDWSDIQVSKSFHISDDCHSSYVHMSISHWIVELHIYLNLSSKCSGNLWSGLIILVFGENRSFDSFLNPDLNYWIIEIFDSI